MLPAYLYSGNENPFSDGNFKGIDGFYVKWNFFLYKGLDTPQSFKILLLLLMKSKLFLFEKHFFKIVKEVIFTLISCWVSACLESFIWAMWCQSPLPYNVLD